MPVSAHADEISDILASLVKIRASHANWLHPDTLALLEKAEQLSAICSEADNEQVVKPFIVSRRYSITLSNTIINSIDAFMRLYNALLASKDNSSMADLILIYDSIVYCSRYSGDILVKEPLPEFLQVARRYNFRLYQ
jgi:hypothetical protein